VAANGMNHSGESILAVKGLTVYFPGSGRKAVDDVSFSVARAETLGVVGESGSGKTLIGLALMGLLPESAKACGSITLAGLSLQAGKEDKWNGVRGRLAGMVFQEPLTALNPVMAIGRQLSESFSRTGEKTAQSRRKTLQLLTELGVTPANRRYSQYPQQLSGGMRQRVMIGIALACSPPLLIADEPTTALDLTVQAQILRLLKQNIQKNQSSLVLISHDFGVIAEMSDRVMVMYGGRVVESAQACHILTRPAHPYTRMLLDAVPRLNHPLPRWTDRDIGEEDETPPFTARCRYAVRCAFCFPRCLWEDPPIRWLSPTHQVRCWQYGSKA
jgi:peptide/nickel transport system ATP-binding protein